MLVLLTLVCFVLEGKCRYADISFHNSKQMHCALACPSVAVLCKNLLFGCQASSDYLLGALQFLIRIIATGIYNVNHSGTACVDP